MIKKIRFLQVGDVFRFHNHKPYNCVVTGLQPTKHGILSLQYQFNDKIHNHYIPEDVVDVLPIFKPMTVAEYIELLHTFDPTAIVVKTSSHINGGFTPIPTTCFVSDNMEYYNNGNFVVLDDDYSVSYHLEDYPNDKIFPAIQV